MSGWGNSTSRNVRIGLWGASVAALPPTPFLVPDDLTVKTGRSTWCLQLARTHFFDRGQSTCLKARMEISRLASFRVSSE